MQSLNKFKMIGYKSTQKRDHIDGVLMNGTTFLFFHCAKTPF